MVSMVVVIVLLFQEPAEPEPPKLDPSEVPALMDQAKAQFLRGEYQEVITTLAPAVEIFDGEAMLLTADAHYGIHTPSALRKARHLYERCIYEDGAIPFPDHSYFQAARIYFWEADLARDNDNAYLASTLEEEGEFYLSRLITKSPDSLYRDQALSVLFDMAVRGKDFGKIEQRANQIWQSSTDPYLLERVEPLTFIRQDPFSADLNAVGATYARHEQLIIQIPELMGLYASKFEELGDLDRAGAMFMDIYSLWPGQENGAEALLRLADLYLRRQDWQGASFLLMQVREEHPDTIYSARAALALARLLEQGHIFNFQVGYFRYNEAQDLVDSGTEDRDLLYYGLLNGVPSGLIPEIINSPLDASIRAEYTYKQALIKSQFGNLEQALLDMAGLLEDYRRGPFVGMYRNFYEQLLYTTIEQRFAAQRYWDLDRLYRMHRRHLSYSTRTRYPELIAKAYLDLGLPTSAIQVYEAMWNYKNSIEGFELAFQSAFIDSLELYNVMRQDSRLQTRLGEYEAMYRNSRRFGDRLMLVKTQLESRSMPPAEFLDLAQTRPADINSIFDARRIRRIAVVAREEAMIADVAAEDARAADNSDGVQKALARKNEMLRLVDKLYNRSLAWQPVQSDLPELWREAKLYQADRLFSLGNYHDSERRYRSIYADDSFEHADRDWSFLQIARLHELQDQLKPSLRIYGQIAYSKDDPASPYRLYAARRLSALATQRNLDKLEKELRIGEF